MPERFMREAVLSLIHEFDRVFARSRRVKRGEGPELLLEGCQACFSYGGESCTAPAFKKSRRLSTFESSEYVFEGDLLDPVSGLARDKTE